jgi:hypothetical protein
MRFRDWLAPDCFSPSRRFDPDPWRGWHWRGRPPRLPRRFEMLLLIAVCLVILAAAFVVGFMIVAALFHP